MEFLAIIVGLLVLIALIAPFVLFFAVMPRVSRLEDDLKSAREAQATTARQLIALTRDLRRLRAGHEPDTGAGGAPGATPPGTATPDGVPEDAAAPASPGAEPDTTAPGTPEPPATVAPDAEGAETPEAAPQREPAQAALGLPKVARSGPLGRPAAAEADGPPAGGQTAKGIEEALTGRWLVWIGGLAVGLSAVFLFTYAIEQGWLGPVPRVMLGLALGASLVTAGEWAHRRVGAMAGARADFVAPALTASGLFALFVSTYAAYGLYGLIPSGVAFAALGAVSFAALALALRQGWFVALLGLAGGYVVPALLESEAPNALPVFLYLLAVTGGCLGLMVWRKWWWLAAATLAGALAWPILWLIGPWTLGDQGVLGSYAVALAALFALLSVGLPVKAPGTPATAWMSAALADTSGLGFTLSGVLVVVVGAASGFNGPAFVFLALYALVGLGLGLRRAAYECLAVIGALIAAGAFLLWPPPVTVSVPDELVRLGVDRYATAFGPYVMPPELVVFARGLLGFALLFGIGGFVALRRGATPAVWGAISTAMPVFLFVMGYWRIGAFEVDIRWAGLAVGLSLAFLAAAIIVGRGMPAERRDAPLALYAAGVTAALALAFACILREAWLTVAIAVEVFALGWLWSRMRVAELRLVAFAAASAVIVRLVLNHSILDYSGGLPGLFGWVLYGYGIPAAAFLGAARLFRTGRGDPLAVLCEAAGAAFAFLLVVFQIRLWTVGAIDHPRYDLFDQSVQSVWWLLAAGFLLRRETVARAEWASIGGRGLLVLAIAQIVLGQVLVQNPLVTSIDVGAAPVFNLLAIAYLVPAVMCWIIASTRGFALTGPERRGLTILAAALAFVHVTLSVRHMFQGGVLTLHPATVPGNAELYAYSAAWIGFALALLGFGIWRGAAFWRYVSLAVLIVTMLKVFLYDLSDLGGLFRVASFLGLGLTLIAIGWVYRRFVFRD